MSPTLTADKVWLALVAASAELRADPRDTFLSTQNTRARAYAYQALRRVYGIEREFAAKLVGGKGTHAASTFLRTAPDKLWWSEATLALIMEAVEPGARIAAVKRRLSHVPPRRMPDIGITAALMGDPVPGRSAWDERQATHLPGEAR